MKCLVGFDDTDSRLGFCTTFLCFQVGQLLLESKRRITAAPRLVRLNPNIPFKTRGNAALAIQFECEEEEEPDHTFATICSTVKKFSDVENGANTGLVFVTERDWNPSTASMFRSVYLRALNEIVNPSWVRRLLSEQGITRTFTLGNGMGLVGAAAALGFDPTLGDDHTYELLAYRRLESCGLRRRVEDRSVRMMDSATFPRTFNNYDYETDRILITPHGPDPVFLGIRGNSPQLLLDAFDKIRYDEALAGYAIYVTNQGTDAHLTSPLHVPLKTYSSGHLRGTVSSMKKGEGGHLYMTIVDADGTKIDAAVYEPTGDLRRVAGLLTVGDVVRIYGGVRRPSSKYPTSVSVEKLEVLSVSREGKIKNPICSRCGSRMKSEGTSKGFQCRRCGEKMKERDTNSDRRDRGEEKRRIRRMTVSRGIVPGIYLPSPRSFRHLARPFTRYQETTENITATIPPAGGWINYSYCAPSREAGAEVKIKPL